jgi:hypothetical protein
MRRFYCPNCHVRLLVGLKSLGLCEQCKAVYDIRRRRHELSAPLWGHPVLWIVALVLVLAFTAAWLVT